MSIDDIYRHIIKQAPYLHPEPLKKRIWAAVKRLGELGQISMQYVETDRNLKKLQIAPCSDKL